MTYDDVIGHFRTQTRLAAALGITQATVSSWGRVVPDRYQYQIEVITGGKLKASEHLRRPANATSSSSAGVAT